MPFPIKSALAEVWAVAKANPRVRKASAAFYATAGLGLLTAASDLHVSTAELRNVAVVSIGAALAAWRIPNKKPRGLLRPFHEPDTIAPTE